MKIKNKILLIIGLTWIIFFGLLYFPTIRDSLLIVGVLVLGFAYMSYCLLHLTIIKRIETLNQWVSNKTSHHDSSHRNDEVDHLRKNIRQMLDHHKATKIQLAHQGEKRTKELELLNMQLQQEIIKIRSIDADAMKSSEYLAHVVRYDKHTALPNHIFFNEILNKAIGHASRRDQILAILLIEINILDQTHREEILNEVTIRLSNTLRSEDILAKLDENEFVILLSDIVKQKFVSTVAEKIMTIFSQPIKCGKNEIQVNANIGICVYPKDGRSLEDLLKNTDSALYKIKHEGKNNYQFYSQEMAVESREYIQLESALRKAIHNNELTVYYQPKFHLKKGMVVGVEALLRWEHPVLGIIDPAQFIPIAEESGLILQLGDWVLREACKMNKRWQEQGYEHLTVAVNLSAIQFQHPDIDYLISSALSDAKLKPHYLEIEINEKSIMTNAESAESMLQKIKATGVKIAIDHFGTGYSSISHLKKFPISLLKIDKSFIKGIPNQPNDLAITNAFIALAHNLGLAVVAEGVETAEQVQHLANQHCDIVQGYFLSHPLPAEKIISQLKKINDEVSTT